MKPRNKSERKLLADGRELVRRYRAGLVDLNRDLARILAEYAAVGGMGYDELARWKAGSDMLRAFSARTKELSDMRAKIIKDRIPRRAAERYHDVLHQARRLVAAAGHDWELPSVPDLVPSRVLPVAIGERIERLDRHGAALYRQILDAVAGGTTPIKLKQIIIAGLARDANLGARTMQHLGVEATNSATMVALEVCQGEILDQLGIEAEAAGLMTIWLHDEPASPRDGHILMHGSHAEDGVWTNPLTGATCTGPGTFGDPAEDRNCLCSLTVMSPAEWRAEDWAGQIIGKGQDYSRSVVAKQLKTG